LELLVQIGPVLNRFGQSAKGKERETRKRHNRQKRFLPEPFGSNLLHGPILDIRGDHCKQHSYSPHDAEDKNREHDETDGNVKAVALEVKPKRGQHDASNRRGDQKNQSKLNHSISPQSHCGPEDSGQCSKAAALDVEVCVIDAVGVMLNQIEESCNSYDRCGHEHADAQ